MPAGGMKAMWVPGYTIEVNPLAHMLGSLKNFGKKVLSSTLRAQISAQKYVEKHGGPLKVNATVLLGDSSSFQTPFPQRVELAVIDPPYGLVRSYATLALTHYASLKIFDALTGDRTIHDVKLKSIASNELILCNRGSYARMSVLFKRLTLAMGESSRAVLMYNSSRSDDWLLMFNIIVNSGLTPIAIYWVLGETPGSLARSKIRGMYLVVLKKGQDLP